METKKRSLAKIATYRIMALTITMLITWLFTGGLISSIWISVTVNAIQMTWHYLHERLWDAIKWQTILCRCESEVIDVVHNMQDRLAGRR